MHPQVDLEPAGKIHVIVELKWHGKKFINSFPKSSGGVTDIFFFAHFSDQNLAQSSGPAPTNAAPGREFKERAGFNRRRGAMRRRVHQVNLCPAKVTRVLFYFFKISGEWTQIYGNIFATTNILFALPRIHMVSWIMILYIGRTRFFFFFN